MANPPPRRVVADYGKPSATGTRGSLTNPTIEAARWQISPQILNMITQHTQFHGLSDEDPHRHLSLFIRICDTFQLEGVPSEAIRLRLFPFSLTDKAIIWLESLPEGSITTWDALHEKFLAKYFPPAKSARLRDMVHSFQQDEGENFYETWDRWRNLLAKCQHHGLERWALVEKFYNGCNHATKRMIDTTAGGNVLIKMTPEECEQFFEELARE